MKKNIISSAVILLFLSGAGFAEEQPTGTISLGGGGGIGYTF